MEVSLSNRASKEQSESVIKDITFPVTLKRKTKKFSKRNKKENIEDLQRLEQGLQFPGRNFVAKPECRILFKKTTEIFSQWLSWQRKILICGMTDRCSKSLLRTMTTVVEPILPAKVSGQSRLEIMTRQTEAKSLALNGTKNGFECPAIQEGSSKWSSHQNASSMSNAPRSRSPFIEELGGIATTAGLYFPDDKSSNSPGNSFLPDIAQTYHTYTSPLTAKLYINDHKHHKRESVVRPTKNFFPDIMFAKGLGKVCAIKSVIQDEAGNRYSSKLFKNRKWWPRSAPENAFFAPSGRKLLETFRSSLESIYQVILHLLDWNYIQSACKHLTLGSCVS